MKRSQNEDDRSGSYKRMPAASPISAASPAWSSSSYSPGYQRSSQPHSKDSRKYLGCSKYSDYDSVGKVGEGTFGEVHQGKNKYTHQLVALKRILMHNETEGIPITAYREIKILKQLNHPNIVPLIEMAVEPYDPVKNVKGSIYMVFPYMDHDLAGLLDNPKVRLSPPQIKTYLKQLLEGTAYLHHNNILHRDMKAANLLINNEGILQIADFGLARGVEDDKKEYTNCVVTRWYRPPELLLGEKRYTNAIDMWGVGCIFGELLKSRPILQGQDDIDQLRKIFALCGSPNQENMPNWESLPDSNKVKFDNYSRHVRDEYHSDSVAADLIDKILVLDPKKRLTALEALEHDYFYTSPLPADPAELPKYEASHEYDRRKPKNTATTATNNSNNNNSRLH